MRQGILKYFRKRFEKNTEEAEVVEAMEVPASTTEDEPKEYAVVNKSYELTLWEPSAKEKIANESEFARLQRELDELNAKIKQAEEGMLGMKQELDDKFRGLVGELYVLRGEIEAKFIESIEGQRNEDRVHIEDDNNGLSDEESEELNRIESSVSGEEAERKKRKELREAKLEAEAKKLYRKIAMRCHSDRTKDSRLIELFDQATKAMDRKDFDRVAEIWALLGGGKAGPSSLLTALLARIAELRDQIHEKNIEFAGIVGDEEFKMWRDYQKPANRPHVEEHYRRRLEFDIRQARAVLASMGVQRYMEPIREEPEIQIHVERTSVRDEPRQARFSELKNLHEGASVMNEKNENELESPWAEDED